MTTSAIIENATIAPYAFRNFSGKETKFNRKGDRNFVIFLDPDKAHELEGLGAPVQWKEDRYHDGELRPQLKVHVKYYDRLGNKLRPPKVVQVTSHGKTALDEETIGLLDTAEIEKADIKLDIYDYNSPNGAGKSCALKTMYATLAEDEFESRYYDDGDEDGDTPW